MKDIWYTFPASMGDNQAWITYNHGFSEIAKNDTRNNVLRVNIDFKDPTEFGMPTNEEFNVLSKVDESLDEAIHKLNGIYVGRLTVNGKRYFYFYLNSNEEEIQKILNHVSKTFNYELQYLWSSDKDKEKYWHELYPTTDDWQVIQDLDVLDNLKEEGDIPEKEREVLHWSYFTDINNASKYEDWLKENQYHIIQSGTNDNADEYFVQFNHIGTMILGDITHHTIQLNRKAIELNGRYDGWETSVERK